jgi:hypothetical protein
MMLFASSSIWLDGRDPLSVLLVFSQTHWPGMESLANFYALDPLLLMMKEYEKLILNF